jgi:regulator of PEP synthase PpsR (kinase-PPPase family)
MSPTHKKIKVIIISDGTGETATGLCRAVMTQFDECEIFFTRFKNVRNKDQIDAIFLEAALHHDLIIYTIVSQDLREYIGKRARDKHVRAVDVMGDSMTAFTNFFNQDPIDEPGLLHAVNDDYFKRVAAMEFTLNHDDGRNVNSLNLADVILVGISRTSKTPLSIYLSQHGIKVVNIPLIKGGEVPKELFEVDQRKIFALTIDPEALREIRQKRLTNLGAKQVTGEYASNVKVVEELEWANELFRQNKRWPVFNVTDKALEETAADIMKLISMRKNNIFKQNKLRTEDKE